VQITVKRARGDTAYINVCGRAFLSAPIRFSSRDRYGTATDFPNAAEKHFQRIKRNAPIDEFFPLPSGFRFSLLLSRVYRIFRSRNQNSRTTTSSISRDLIAVRVFEFCIIHYAGETLRNASVIYYRVMPATLIVCKAAKNENISRPPSKTLV